MSVDSEKRVFTPMSDETWFELRRSFTVKNNPIINHSSAYNPLITPKTENKANDKHQPKMQKIIYSCYDKGDKQKSYSSILLLLSLCGLLYIVALYCYLLL